MESFDKFLSQNKDILSTIKPLSAAERESVYFEMKNGFSFKKLVEQGENITEEQKILYFARKNRMCPALQLCKHAIAKENQKQLAYKLSLPTGRWSPKVDNTSQLMDLDKAKRIFWHVYLKDCFHPKAYVIDDYNRTIIDELVKYFIRDPSCRLNLSKGICLAGGVGTGKTELMKSFCFFLSDQDLPNSFEFKDMRSIIRQCGGKEGLSAIDPYLTKNYCFDDIAIRQTKIKSFGTEISPLDEIIQGRYKRFMKRNSRPTHFTTNLDFNPSSPEEKEKLLSFYDERSIDRIKQMCNFIYMGGKSRRE